MLQPCVCQAAELPPSDSCARKLHADCTRVLRCVVSSSPASTQLCSRAAWPLAEWEYPDLIWASQCGSQLAGQPKAAHTRAAEVASWVLPARRGTAGQGRLPLACNWDWLLHDQQVLSSLPRKT